jgi:SAM-dependent methyltransferase
MAQPPALASDAYADRLRALVPAPPWCFDLVHVADDHVEIQGWALMPPGGAQDVTFTINDAEFDRVIFPLPWPKIHQLFWYWPTAVATGFACRANRSHGEAFLNGATAFKYVDRRTGQSLNPLHDCFYPDPERNRLPFPDPPRRRRVHGDALLSAFVLEGFSTLTKLARILDRVAGKTYADFDHILDWGCGCGRLTRYFADRTAGSLTGIDIDADNIAWCQRHLPAARFLVVPPYPPTPLPDAAFDLILGVSIFTHLREADQFSWLEELQRLARPGAIVMVTIHGETTVGRAALPASSFAQLEAAGFLDLGHNPGLDHEIAESGYYRNTFHLSGYIRQHWSRYFDLLDIVPGTIGNHQDVVVMRKT